MQANGISSLEYLMKQIIVRLNLHYSRKTKTGNTESQHSAPYETDSIQYYMSQQIKSDYDYLIDDDGCGEVADLVAINNSERIIDVTLYHLKFARGGKVSNSIENLYQVCGQAQKSVRWKYVGGYKLFDHILKRN